jgi:hypothetical protein
MVSDSSGLNSLRRAERIVWLWIVLTPILVGAYFTMLTGFREWDDEGSLMLSVRQYLGGMKIYKDVFSVYGPVYYYYNAFLRTVTGTPVTHDVTRLSTLLPWSCCCLLSTWVVFRLTKSMVAACASMFFVSQSLGFFHNEPGHPQELTLMLLIGIFACSCVRPLGTTLTAAMMGIGVLAAALCFIKVNIGAFVCISVALTLIGSRPFRAPWSYILIAAAAGYVLLPLLLMRNHIDAGWARIYCGLVTIGAAGVVVNILCGRSRGELSARQGIWCAAGFGSGVVLVLASIVAQDISLGAMINSLLVLPARVFAQNRDWYYPPPLSAIWLPYALAGLCLGIYAAARASALARNLPESSDGRWLAGLKAFVGLSGFLAICIHVPLLPLIGPFSWLLLYGTSDAKWQTLPRALLCTVGLLQTLYGYPVYGSQAEFIDVSLVIVAAVCIGDALRSPAFSRWTEAAKAGDVLITRVALCLILALSAGVALNRYRNYTAYPALDLPGARLMHVEPKKKEEFQTIVRGIEGHCDSFESLPGLPSFNFWTGINPLTGLNSDAWTLYLDANQQVEIVRRLSEQPRPCVLVNPRWAAFWNPGRRNLDSLPLVKYMREGFSPVLSAGEYSLMVPKQ